MFRSNKKGQSILEYAMLVGVLVAVIVAIQIYVKRAVQGKLKSSADQIGEQFTTGQTYTTQTIRQSARKEETLVGSAGTGAGQGWTNSSIQATGDASWAANLGTYQKVAGQYKGAEVTATDFVDAATNAGAVGTHSSFDSGKLTDKKLLNDDE